MHRLAAVEWRTAAEDLTGVVHGGSLSDDFVLHGFTSVGAAEVSVAPLEIEVIEAVAWDVADASLPEGASPDDLLGCQVSPDLGTGDPIDAEPCVRAFAVRCLTRAFRRPATRADVEQ